MDILQVVPNRVHPPDTGGDHRKHGLMDAFVSAGDNVIRYCQGGDPTNYLSRELETWIDIESGYREVRVNHPFHDLASVTVLFDFPYVYLGPTLKRVPTETLLNELERADVVFVEGPWQVSAVDSLLDDGLLVYSSHNYEPERFSTFASGTCVHRYFYEKVEAAERDAVSSADLVVCTSERDMEIYRREFEDVDIYVAPNGTYVDEDPTVDTDRNQQIRDELDVGDDESLGLFVGSKHTPNIEALRLIHDIASDIDSEGIHLVAVGTACDDVDRQSSNVEQLGFVKDIEPYFEAADFAVHPMISGGGTNIKLFDYFNWGLPVISTEFGARGLDVMDNHNIVISEVEGFPESIRRLHRHPDLREDIGNAAREFVREKYDWREISRELREKVLTYVNDPEREDSITD